MCVCVFEFVLLGNFVFETCVCRHCLHTWFFISSLFCPSPSMLLLTSTAIAAPADVDIDVNRLVILKFSLSCHLMLLKLLDSLRGLDDTLVYCSAVFSLYVSIAFNVKGELFGVMAQPMELSNRVLKKF